MAAVKARFEALAPFLGERDRRLWAASEAYAAGHGGILAVSVVTGIARSTIGRGLMELGYGKDQFPGRVRRPGGGRRLKTVTEPADSRGIARGCSTRWRTWCSRPRAATRKPRCCGSAAASAAWPVPWPSAASRPARSWSDGCCAAWASACRPTARPGKARTARTATPSSSTSTPRRRRSKPQASPPSRWTRRGRSWSATSRTQAASCAPRASPSRSGRTTSPCRSWARWRPTASATSRPTRAGPASASTRDTAAFAVESIRRWWHELGQPRYLDAKRLLITADCGGGNGARVRLWKTELQALADQTGLSITVAHLPPGTSKWNRIEHRLFAFVTQNWRGKPLLTHQVIVQLIASTTTQAGLTVQCRLDENAYEKGTKVSDAQVASLNIASADSRGEWNYTIAPRKPDT